MNGDVLNNSTLITKTNLNLIKKQQENQQKQPFNFTTKNNNNFLKNNKNENLTSVLHGFIVNGLTLTSLMKTEKEQINNNYNEDQSSSNSKNLNFKNSWQNDQKINKNDILSQTQEVLFNDDLNNFEELEKEKGEKTKKNDQELNNNEQIKKLENKKNNYSLFSTKMLITTINDLKKNKKENQSSLKNDLLEEENNNIILPIKNKKKKKPYKELTLEQKVELIRLAERCTNLSQASIAERYSIAKSNVCRILQRKTEYIKALECSGFAGSRKRKLRTAINLIEEEEEENENNILLINKKNKIFEKNKIKNKGRIWKNEEIEINNNFDEKKIIKFNDLKEFNNGRDDENGGSSVLRAHMSSSHHKHKGRRNDNLCRCCNLAFRDKTELHKHLKNHNNNNTNDNYLSEDVLLPTIENNQINNSLVEQYNNGHQIDENEEIKNSLNNKIHNPSIDISNNSENDKNTISSALQLLQQQQQNFLLANLWSNILLSRQQTEQNLHENKTTNICSENGFDETDKISQNIRCASATTIKENDNINFNFGNNMINNSISPSLNTCSSSSASSSVIVQTIKISKASITSPINSYSSSSYISTTPNVLENDLILSNTDSILTNLNENTETKQQSPLSSPLFASLFNTNDKCNQRQEQSTTDEFQHLQCMQCALLKPKLQSVSERSSYLEAYNTTFQNELIRLNAKCLLAEQCIRRLELELRQWRERNDILRFRLLECREKTLAIIGHINGYENISTADLSNFLGEILKITLV